jgi:hypothetical protein
MNFLEEDSTEAHERRIRRCSQQGCRTQIIFLPNPATGRSVPVDADTVEPEHSEYDPAAGHISHFRTCTAPDRFSKSRR